MSAVYLFGSGAYAIACLKALQTKHTIKKVVSYAGDPLTHHSEKQSIPTEVITAKALKTLEVDADTLLLCVNFKNLLPDSLLKQVNYHAINMHSSLLPEYKGFSPLSWSIIHGTDRIGVTAHYMDNSVDGGNIITQTARPFSAEETVKHALDWLFEIYPETLLRAIDLYEQGYQGEKQAASDIYWPRRRPEDGIIDWNQGVQQLHNWIRALTHPYPGAFSYVNGVYQVTIYSAQIERQDSIHHEDVLRSNGCIIHATTDELLIKCSDGYLKVTHYDCQTTLKSGDLLEPLH